MEQQSLLSEMEFSPVLASTGQRFANYLIDAVIFFIVIAVAGITMVYSIDETPFSETSDTLVNELIFRIVYLLMYALVYFLIELIFKGRTIGKLITGTKAVNQDGSEMEAKTILSRSLIRAIPFEQLSALGSPCFPWHDKWSKTYVIDIKKTKANEINLL
jgi:uncharacterized RDD family membrane protein YckC